jgi:Holliday junction resolvasome RuvABC endonuclease subunit
MEINGQQVNTLRETTKLAQAQGIYKVIFQFVATMRKSDRVLSMLESIAQKHGVILYASKLKNKIHKTYVQMLTLGQKDMKDDWPDSLAIAFSKAMIPPKQVLPLNSQWKRQIPLTESDANRRQLASDAWITI